MSIYEIVFNEITNIFNYNVSWLPLANEIMSYIITSILLVLMLLIPTILLFWVIRLFGGLENTDINYIKGRKKRKWKNLYIYY